VATLAALVALAVGPVAVPGVAQAAPQAAATVSVATTAPTALVLTGQSPWLTPGQPFDLRVALGRGAGSAPASSLGLTLSVYSCLTSVSGFDEAAASDAAPSGRPISSSPVLPWTALPAAVRGVALDIPVSTASDPATSTGPGGYVIDLHDADAGCGVYPVRVELVASPGGAVIGGITTFLVYTDAAADTERLRFAEEVPLATTVAATGHRPTTRALLADPAAGLSRPAAAQVAALDATVAAVAADPSVPVTLDVSPQTVQLLATSGHRATVTTLAQLATTPAVHQLLAAPYTQVSAPALVDAGLSTELTRQVQRGGAVLAGNGLHVSPSAGDLGPWVTAGGVDTGTLASLAALGYNQLVLPAGAVADGPAPSPRGGSSAQPFTLATTRQTSVTAITSNADVSSRFAAAPGDPVLAAQELLANLAQIYFEGPNLTTPRAVVAVPPSGWTADPVFVSTLLAGLDGNPIVAPVTMTQLFATFTSPASCGTSGCRLAASPAPSGLPTTAIRVQRARIDGFASAYHGPAGLPQQLGDVLLAGESADLRPSQQAAVVQAAGRSVDAQLSQFAMASDQSITLTARTGTVPVIFVSSADYALAGTLVLSSDKLLFTNQKTKQTGPTVDLDKKTNVTPVVVQARASGEFKLSVALVSPDDDLVLTSGQVSVRSTATSIVGVVLSLGAVAVLLVWWVRTSLRNRRKRRADEGAAA